LKMDGSFHDSKREIDYAIAATFATQYPRKEKNGTSREWKRKQNNDIARCDSMKQ